MPDGEFAWWQPAISAGFGALAGFFGGRASKWLDDRAARSAHRIDQAWTAMRDHSLAALRRLEELDQLSDDELVALFAQERGPLPAGLHIQLDEAAKTLDDVMGRLRGTEPRAVALGARLVQLALASASLAWVRGDRRSRYPDRSETETEQLLRQSRDLLEQLPATERVRESLQELDRRIRDELQLLRQVKP